MVTIPLTNPILTHKRITVGSILNFLSHNLLLTKYKFYLEKKPAMKPSKLTFISSIASTWIANAKSLRLLKDKKIKPTQTSFETCVITDEQDCNYAYLKDSLPEGKNFWVVMPGGDSKVCVKVIMK